MSHSSFVKITVYDVLGREAAVLVNGELKAGRHIVDWNATNFASGIYFYELKALDFNEVKKMVLIK
ncbi:MAG: T9SS type A sorting domain-containing protein [Chlorobi bacterium]|nr:T9SS type A sorting domain-containing protein [Chlorobiota bacterium]MCI0714967.1 T9SS type A sorting domain-containing protein [Chlorobiota bacterium]